MRRSHFKKALFEQKVKFSVPCWKSRHPELNAYITDILEGIRYDLFQGTVQELHVLIVNAQNESEIIEKFTFDIESYFGSNATSQSLELSLNLKCDVEAFKVLIPSNDKVQGPTSSRQI